MGAQQGGSDAIKRMQLAAAGRSRRADAIGRRSGKGTGNEINEAFMGGNPNFDERGGMPVVPGEGRPYDARGQFGNYLGGNTNKASFAEFLTKLAQNKRR